MPSIVIKEFDDTTGGGSTGLVDIVYVPGFRVSKSNADAWKDGDSSNAAPIQEPVLCETVSEFRKYFGTQPATCAEGLYYGKLKDSPTDRDIYGQTPITKDLSYIYAIELLNNGVPVLYEAVAELNQITVDDLKSFYVYLADSVDGPFGRLRERGEFDVKYLTTGGYANYALDFGTLTKSSIYEKDPINLQVKTKNNINTLATLMLRANCSEGRFSVTHFDDQGPTPEILWGFTPLTENSTFAPSGDELASYMSTYFDIDKSQLSFDSGFTLGIEEIKVSNLADTITDCAAARGDAIALIDPVNNIYQPLVGDESFYNSITLKVSNWDEKATYATAFIPSVNIDTTQLSSNDTYLLPGSYAYLAALGQSMKNNPSWLAIAGAARGGIPNLNGANPFNLEKRLTNTIAETEYQNRDYISINAITNIKPFGQRIWGNRTLKNNAEEGNLTATSFLNIRNLVCDVKKIVYQACKKYTFEQNNDILWTNFKAYIEPTLEKMRTGAGISGYKIIKGTTTEKAKLVATVRLYPIYAVEDFEITVIMSDDEVSVS